MGRGDGGDGVGRGGGGWVFLPHGIGLVCFRGEKIKGETETKRDCAINITQAAQCRSKEALKGWGAQTERGRHGGIFMGEKTLQVCMLLSSLDAFCSCASKEGERRRVRKRRMTENENCGGYCCL